MLPLPVVTCLVGVCKGGVRAQFVDTRSTFKRLGSQILRSISKIEIIHTCIRRETSRRHFRRLARSICGGGVRITGVSSLFRPAVGIVINLDCLVKLKCNTCLIFRRTVALNRLISFGICLNVLV